MSLQAQASEASGRALGERVAAVAAGTAREQAQGHRLRRALEAIGDGAAATARHVAALRARLRWAPAPPRGLPIAPVGLQSSRQCPTGPYSTL